MEIVCNYKNNFWIENGLLYTCKITSASIKETNQEITSIIGCHETGKNDPDVEAIWFDQTKVHYMPKGIKNFFPNLKAIKITECGLKEVYREDLVGLENIEMLDLNSNYLTSLPDDLFEGMKKLKEINFSNNKLEFVSSQLFQPVLENRLIYVDFSDNPTVSAIFDGNVEKPSDLYVELSDLMKLIDENCKKPQKVEVKSLEVFNSNFVQGFKGLWSSGHLSDFTIIAGDQKFSVHKTVLSIQSEFFAETFMKDEENSLTEIKIEDLNADAVEEVLRWIYTGKTPGVKNGFEIFALTIKLQISGLKEIAEDLVALKLDQKNAMEVFELGNRYKSEKLKDLAFKEIKKFLNEPNLNRNLKSKPENLKELVEAKKNYEEKLKRLNEV